MNTKEFVAELAKRAGCSEKEARSMIKALSGAVADTLPEYDIQFGRVGDLTLALDDTIVLDPQIFPGDKIPVFRPSRALQNKVRANIKKKNK